MFNASGLILCKRAPFHGIPDTIVDSFLEYWFFISDIKSNNLLVVDTIVFSNSRGICGKLKSPGSSSIPCFGLVQNRVLRIFQSNFKKSSKLYLFIKKFVNVIVEIFPILYIQKTETGVICLISSVSNCLLITLRYFGSPGPLQEGGHLNGVYLFLNVIFILTFSPHDNTGSLPLVSQSFTLA